MAKNDNLNNSPSLLNDSIEISMYLDNDASYKNMCKEVNIVPFLVKDKLGYIERAIEGYLENGFYGIKSSIINSTKESKYIDEINILSKDDLKEVNAMINGSSHDYAEQMPGVIPEYSPPEEPEIISCELEPIAQPILLTNLDISSALSEQISSMPMILNDYALVDCNAFYSSAELSIGCFGQMDLNKPIY